MAGIAKLIGKVNGDTVIFKKDDGGHWETVVPKDLNGEYIMEVQAFDDAGNCAYSAQMVFTVDIKTLAVTLRPLNYKTDTMEPVFQIEMPSSFGFKEVVKPFNANCLPQNYKYKVV